MTDSQAEEAMRLLCGLWQSRDGRGVHRHQVWRDGGLIRAGRSSQSATLSCTTYAAGGLEDWRHDAIRWRRGYIGMFNDHGMMLLQEVQSSRAVWVHWRLPNSTPVTWQRDGVQL